MDFGLGLVLSFTDNATAGINNAVNSLNNLTNVAEKASTSLNEMASLSAFSVVSNQIGDSFLKAGSSILGVFTNLLGKVRETGSDFEGFRITLNSLYGDAEKAENAISKLLDFSIKSPFEVNEVKDMLTVLQSQGLDAFEQVQGSISGTRQETLSWIADLMAFKPDVLKDRWKLAIQNFVGSGDTKMLRNILDMGKIDEVLGHDIGKTTEERMNNLIEIVEKKNLIGLAEKMSTSWSGVASNVSDAFTKIYKSIADNGVFENLKASMMSVSGAILALDNESLEALGKTLADAINTILAPIVKIAEKVNVLFQSLVNLAQTNPELVKMAVIFSIIAGASLVLIGVTLKLASAIGFLTLGLQSFGTSFSVISATLKTGAVKILGVLLPLIATIGLLALAWKSDFAGIRTNVSYFVNGLMNSFRTASQAVNGSAGDMLTTFYQLRKQDDFFSNLTIGVMKFMMVFKALKDAWNDNELSESNFMKIRDLGLLPLIEAILDLKYRFGLFKEGFVAGWTDIMNGVKSAVSGFTTSIKGTALEGFIDNITSLFQRLASGDAQAWFNFGKSFADFTAKSLVFVVALKALDGVLGAILKISAVFSVFSKFTGIVSGAGKIVSSSFNAIKTAFTTFLPWVSSILGGIVEGVKLVIGGAGSVAEVLRLVFTPLTGVVSFVGGAILAITNFFGMLKEGFSWVKEAVMIVGIALSTVGAIIAGVSALPAVIVGAIVGAIATIVVLVKQNWENIKSVLSTIGSWIYNNVIAPVVNFFNTYIFPIISKVVEVVAKVVEIISVTLGLLVSFIYTNVIEPIGSFFGGLWEGVKEVFADVVEFFSGVFSSAAEAIKNFFSPLVGFFKGVWDGIVSLFSTVGVVIADAISGVVRGAINAVLQGAVGIINGFISAINLAISVLNAVPGVNISRLSKLEVPMLAQGGIVDSPMLSVIGEQGREAVVPLENNTGWITNLSNMISEQLSEIRPTNTHRMTSSATGQRMYSTTNNSNTQTIHGDTDNSVVFNAGAIQVNLQNATEAEAMKLAKTIMEYIKRQNELNNMTRYAT